MCYQKLRAYETGCVPLSSQSDWGSPRSTAMMKARDRRLSVAPRPEISTILRTPVFLKNCMSPKIFHDFRVPVFRFLEF